MSWAIVTLKRRLARLACLLVLSLVFCQSCHNNSPDPSPAGEENHAPVIQFLRANPESVTISDWMQLQCSATDADGDVLTITWTGPGEFETPGSVDTRWRHDNPGDAVINCRVADQSGLADEAQVTVHVQNLPPGDLQPQITGITADMMTVAAGDPIELICSATDFEGGTLSFFWAGPGVFATPDRFQTQWTGNTPGTYEIACFVSDAAGNRASDSIVLQVTTKLNSAPEISEITATPSTFDFRDGTTLMCIATDPEGAALTFAWEGPGSFSNHKTAQTNWRIMRAGDYSLTCKVTDTAGASAMAQVPVHAVVNDTIIAIEEITAEPETALPGAQVDLNCIVSGAGNDVVSFLWSGPGVFGQTTAAQTTWSIAASGEYTLQCRATPQRGPGVTASVSVTVLSPSDSTPPTWTGGTAGLMLTPFEGFVSCSFNSATDEESPPVSYTLYYAPDVPGEPFDPGTANKIEYMQYPVMPVRIDGLALGQTYEFVVVATDNAPSPNSTIATTGFATPQVFFDVAPEGDHTFAGKALSPSMVSLSSQQAQLCVVWVDPDFGHLCEAHSANGVWITRQVLVSGVPQRWYVLARVLFFGGRPVVVASDNAGHLDLLRQRADARWDGIEVYSSLPGVRHSWLDMVLDPEDPVLHVGHVTEIPGPPHTEEVNYLQLSLISGGNPVLKSITGRNAAQYVGQLRVRNGPFGKPALAYVRGIYSLTNPDIIDTSLVISTYEPFAGSMSDELVPLSGEPLFVDVQPAAGAWDVLTSELDKLALSGTEYIGTRLLRYNNNGGIWLPWEVDSSNPVEIEPGRWRYDVMLENALLPGGEWLYYCKGEVNSTPPEAVTNCLTRLWSGPAATAEPGEALAQLSVLNIGSIRYVLGIEAASTYLSSFENPATFSPGPVTLRQLE